LLHGLGVSVVHLKGRIVQNLHIAPWIKILITFHFVTFGWIFFRAPNLQKVGEIVAAPFISGWVDVGSFLSINKFPILLIFIALVLHRIDNHRYVKVVVRRVRPEIVWPVLIFCWILAITVSQGNSAKFIYFDF
jgi:alginate O-acetyltransferase complex protein AlgI